MDGTMMLEGLPTSQTRKLRIGLRTIVADAGGEDAIVEVRDLGGAQAAFGGGQTPRLLHGPGFDANANACPITETANGALVKTPTAPVANEAMRLACMPRIAAAIAAGSE